MPAQLTYPGVYVEELSSGVHTIVGVATSITAFVGAAPKGPIDEATLVTTWSDFDKQFGGLVSGSPLGYAVSQFFGNGGQSAYIVRLASLDANPATVTIGPIVFTALNPGQWAEDYQIAIKNQTDKNKKPTGRFRIQVVYAPTGAPAPAVVESFENLGIVDPDPQGLYFVDVLEKGSSFIKAAISPNAALDGNGNPTVPGDVPPTLNPVAPPAAAAAPTATAGAAVGGGAAPAAAVPAAVAPAVGAAVGAAPAAGAAALQPPPNQFGGGNDGAPLYVNSGDFVKALNLDLNEGSVTPGVKEITGGLALLNHVDIFNLLCVPGETDPDTLSSLEGFCEKKRAFLIADSDPSITKYQSFVDAQGSGLTGTNAAFYFPRVEAPDPLNNNVVRPFPPCGFVAGMYATTDSNRGVWKAPAGTETALKGVTGVDVSLTNPQNGFLNPLGINCIRKFPVYGTVIWGARTTDGNDEMASQWKYIPVRRTALFIEESLYRGTQWVVFEPNDEPLWAQIRLNVGAFMHDLFRQGAFQGSTPKDAYLVKCDKETTTQNDIDRGIVNILVGFAPLKPAEFVVLQIQQLAGQIQT